MIWSLCSFSDINGFKFLFQKEMNEIKSWHYRSNLWYFCSIYQEKMFCPCFYWIVFLSFLPCLVHFLHEFKKLCLLLILVCWLSLIISININKRISNVWRVQISPLERLYGVSNVAPVVFIGTYIFLSLIDDIPMSLILNLIPFPSPSFAKLQFLFFILSLYFIIILLPNSFYPD